MQVWSLGKLAAFTSLATRSKVTPAKIVEHLTDIAVCSEAVYLTIEASELDNGTISRTSTHIIMGFLGYFTLDVIAKLILLGRRGYFAYVSAAPVSQGTPHCHAPLTTPLSNTP